jgi:hypothetical protein
MEYSLKNNMSNADVKARLLVYVSKKFSEARHATHALVTGSAGAMGVATTLVWIKHEVA